MLLSKHVWRNRRRGVLLVACSNKSTRTSFHLWPPPQVLGSNGSFAKAFYSKQQDEDAPSSSRLLQTVQDVGALHLHQQANPASVLYPSTNYVSDGTSSSKSKPNGRGLPSSVTRKASSVTQTVEDMCLGSPRFDCKHGSSFHSLQRDETPSAMPVSSLEQNKGAHRQRRSRKNESALHHHQSITESYTAPLGSLEDKRATHLPQHDGKNEQLPLLSQKHRRAAKKTAEYCGTLLLTHGFLPASISNIVKSVPACKRTQVHFENIVSLSCLLQTMGIDRDSIPVIIKKAPFMYQRNPVLHLEHKIAYLEMLGLHRTEVRRLVLKYPYVLRSPIQDIQAQIQVLRGIPLKHEDVLTILRKDPMVFRLRVETYLQPKLEFFRSLGISETDIGKMLLGNPRLLHAQLCKLQKVVHFMQGLGLQPGTKKFSYSLMIWGYNKVEILQSRLESLSNVGLSPKEVVSLATSLPSILATRTQHITDKLNYLVDVMKRSAREVLKYPPFLGLSLDKRIRPRHEALVQWTAEKQVNKHFSLSHIFRWPDKAFSIQFSGIVVKNSQ